MHLLLSLSAVVIVYDVVVIVNQSSISHVCLHAHTLWSDVIITYYSPAGCITNTNYSNSTVLDLMTFNNLVYYSYKLKFAHINGQQQSHSVLSREKKSTIWCTVYPIQATHEWIQSNHIDVRTNVA